MFRGRPWGSATGTRFPDYGETSVPNSHSEQFDTCGENSMELGAVGVELPGTSDVGVFMEVDGYGCHPAIGVIGGRLVIARSRKVAIDPSLAPPQHENQGISLSSRLCLTESNTFGVCTGACFPPAFSHFKVYGRNTSGGIPGWASDPNHLQNKITRYRSHNIASWVVDHKGTGV